MCEIAKTWKQTFFETLFCDKKSDKVYFIVTALCGEITVPALPRLRVFNTFFIKKYLTFLNKTTFSNVIRFSENSEKSLRGRIEFP